MVGGVSVAGFLPGLGRGGMTHSLLVMEVLGGSEAIFAIGTPGPGVPAIGWMARCGVEEDGVETLGEVENSDSGEEAVVGEMASLVGRGLEATLEDESITMAEDDILYIGQMRWRRQVDTSAGHPTGARQNQSMITRELLHRQCCLGLRVLDQMAFIQDAVVPTDG